jgi:hypothetical protein
MCRFDSHRCMWSVRVSSSGALAFSVAWRLAEPRRLTAALAAAAPSEDTLTSQRRSATAHASKPIPHPLTLSRTRRASLGALPRIHLELWEARHRASNDGRRINREVGRRSSKGAAAASAAARRRDSASRQATLKARAPEEDLLPTYREPLSAKSGARQRT